MATERQPPSEPGAGDALILAAIDRPAAGSRSDYERLAADLRRGSRGRCADIH